jgi:hypothetical protein
MIIIYCLTVRRLLQVLDEFKNKNGTKPLNKDNKKTKKNHNKKILCLNRSIKQNNENFSKNEGIANDIQMNGIKKVKCLDNNLLRQNNKPSLQITSGNVTSPVNSSKKVILHNDIMQNNKLIDKNQIGKKTDALKNATAIKHISTFKTEVTIEDIHKSKASIDEIQASSIIITQQNEALIQNSKKIDENQILNETESSKNSNLKVKKDFKLEFKAVVNKQRLVNKAVVIMKQKQESARVENEKKAVKVLGICGCVFLVAWGPFSIYNLVYAVLQSTTFSPSYTILNVLTWLGYISSSINPIVYTIVNKKFRNAFISILKCNFKALNAKNHTLNNVDTKVACKIASMNLKAEC